MPSPTSALFGDALALARERWVSAMAAGLVEKGYPGYRRSDAYALRFLSSGPHALGAFAAPVGGSRQRARKVVTGLIKRGYASLETDHVDARRRQVHLTAKGHAYAEAVIQTLGALNRAVAERVTSSDLAAAMRVLAFVKDEFTPVA
ncbi:MAG: MarR family winged helix-turn-helix transcriptional regulator [Acidimicrobiales bacterium]